MTLELFYQITATVSLSAFVVSVVFMTYVILKTQKLNPYTIFAIGTAKAILSKRFRDILILSLMSTLVLLIGHLAKFFFENKLLYKAFEVSALLMFLIATSVLILSYVQQEKTKSNISITKPIKRKIFPA